MLARKLLVVVVTAGLFLVGTGTALAWELVNDKQGNGRVLLRAWSREYNQVAFVADHAGTRVDVAIKVECRDGYHFEDTWSDGGRRFRFILRGLRDNGRCDHNFKVEARSAVPDLYLALYVR